MAYLTTLGQPPRMYSDPDARDAYSMAMAAYYLAEAGEDGMSAAAAEKAAALMAGVPYDKNGDKTTGSLTYYHYGILSVSAEYATYEVAAPTFQPPPREEQKPASKKMDNGLRRSIQAAYRYTEWGWFPELQVRAEISGKPGTVRTGLAPAITLKKLLPILTGYSPDLPDAAQAVLAEKADKILSRNSCGSYSKPWYQMLNDGDKFPRRIPCRILRLHGNEPTYHRTCALPWFEKDDAEAAAKVLFAYRSAPWEHLEEITAFVPRCVIWPRIDPDVVFDDPETQRRQALLRQLTNDERQGYAACQVFDAGISMAVKTCEILRFHDAILKSGSDYLIELAEKNNIADRSLDVPEGVCAAAGLLGAVESAAHLYDGPLRPDMLDACLRSLSEDLAARQAAGALDWKLETPDDEKDKKED